MNILLADNHPEVRAALRLMIEQGDNCRVCGEAADAAALLIQVVHSCPDVVLLEMDLCGRPKPGRRSLPDLMETLHMLCPSMQVIAFSSLPDERNAALAAGANGFICKSDPLEMLVDLLEKIHHEVHE